MHRPIDTYYEIIKIRQRRQYIIALYSQFSKLLIYNFKYMVSIDFMYIFFRKNHNFVRLFTTTSAASRNSHTDISCICTLFFIMPGGGWAVVAGGTLRIPTPLAAPESDSPLESVVPSLHSGPNFT